MPQQNVDQVRAFYEHFNRTGEPPWDLFDPGATWDASSVPGFGVIRGREGVLAAISEYTAAFEDWRIEPEEVIDAGEKVVVVVRDGGRLKEGGAEVHNRFVHVWTLRSGKVIAWKTFTDRARALEAAGLGK